MDKAYAERRDVGVVCALSTRVISATSTAPCLGRYLTISSSHECDTRGSTGLGGSAVICAAYPLFMVGMGRGTLLGFVAGLGALSSISFGSSYQLVSHFPSRNIVALSVGAPCPAALLFVSGLTRRVTRWRMGLFFALNNNINNKPTVGREQPHPFHATGEGSQTAETSTGSRACGHRHACRLQTHIPTNTSHSHAHTYKDTHIQGKTRCYRMIEGPARHGASCR